MTYSLWRHLHPPPTVYRTILVHATDKRSFTTCSLTVVSSTNGLLQRSRSETWSLIADRSDRLTRLRFLHLTNSFSALYAIFFALSDRIWVTYDVTHHAHVHRIKTDLCVCTTEAWLQRSFASARFFRRLLLWVILEIRSRSVTSVEFTYGRRSVSINKYRLRAAASVCDRSLCGAGKARLGLQRLQWCGTPPHRCSNSLNHAARIPPHYVLSVSLERTDDGPSVRTLSRLFFSACFVFPKYCMR